MFFRRLNWNVVGWFQIVSFISYVVIAAGLASMVYHYATTGSALRLGLSFTGGTDVTVKFNRSVTKDELLGALAKVGVTDAQVNTLGKTGDVGTPRWTIETQHDFGNNSAPLKDALSALAPVDNAQFAISTVGPSLSHEYLYSAIEALVIAIGIQFIYIAFRFGWNYIYGLVTVIALVRDSAMMIGIYSMAGRRVDDAFLAAVLTVVGYSVMDTIVILDRIRENVKLMAGEPFEKIVNTSILQTMTRSVNTLATVVITLVALLALGGASLQNFAFALLVGICSGGYHSIFYSAPLVARLQAAYKRRSRAAAALEGTPRTVAEARSQTSKSVAERAEILAQRKARRERERLAAQRQPASGPVRYKRQRPEAPQNGVIGTVEVEHEYLESEYEDVEEGDVREIDPLDAQASGLHDRDYDLGHEEITLNFEGLDEPAPHDETQGHAEPAAHGEDAAQHPEEKH